MQSNPNVKNKKEGQARPTLGYLTNIIQSGTPQMLWAGVADAARQQDVNLICFPGNRMSAPASYHPANILYDLVSADRLDGLLCWASSVLDRGRDATSNAASLQHYGLPVISLTLPLPNIPTVLIDNYDGLQQAIAHLIEAHGYRHIAFLRGPMRHPYAQQRYRAYVDTLEAHNIIFEPALVTPPGDWTRASGETAIDILLDERGLIPGETLEAIVAVNDALALGAIAALQRRGLQAPKDVAVLGFNDLPIAQLSSPPLTSVRMPFYEQGQRGVAALLAVLAGEEVPELMRLSSQPVLRQSCGCQAPVVAAAAAGGVTPGRKKLSTATAAQRDEIVADVAQAIGVSEKATLWAGQLVDSFTAELAKADVVSGKLQGAAFLWELDTLLSETQAAGGLLEGWHAALSTLRRHLLPYIPKTSLSRAEDLWQQGRTLVGEAVKRAQAVERFQAEAQETLLRDITQALITAGDIENIVDVLTENLPKLQIPTCFLSLYENPSTPAEQARLVLAYRDAERIALPPEGQTFPTPQLLPEDMLNPEKRYTLVVEPLYIQASQIGFVLFEINTQGENVYEVLRTVLSAALHSALLVQRQRETQAALEQAYQHTADEKERAETARNVAEVEKERAEAALNAVEVARTEAEQAHRIAEAEKARAETVNQALEAQVWQANGMAQLNNVMRGEQSITELGRSVIRQLCQYLDVLTGVIYLREDDTLRFVGGYAYPDDLVTHCKIGQGPLGEAAFSQTPLLFKNIPANQQTLSSGLFRAAPCTIWVVPFLYEGETVGVIELGKLTEFAEIQRTFLESALESISIAFKTAQARAQINTLLAQTQQQAMALQMREGGLCVINEGLEEHIEK